MHALNIRIEVIDYQNQSSAIKRGTEDYKEDPEKDVSLRSRNRLWIIHV
jgi:hypothetical protein